MKLSEQTEKVLCSVEWNNCSVGARFNAQASRVRRRLTKVWVVNVSSSSGSQASKAQATQVRGLNEYLR